MGLSGLSGLKRKQRKNNVGILTVKKRNFLTGDVGATGATGATGDIGPTGATGPSVGALTTFIHLYAHSDDQYIIQTGSLAGGYDIGQSIAFVHEAIPSIGGAVSCHFPSLSHPVFDFHVNETGYYFITFGEASNTGNSNQIAISRHPVVRDPTIPSFTSCLEQTRIPSNKNGTLMTLSAVVHFHAGEVFSLINSDPSLNQRIRLGTTVPNSVVNYIIIQKFSE